MNISVFLWSSVYGCNWPLDGVVIHQKHKASHKTLHFACYLLLLLLQNMVVILCTVCKYSVCIDYPRWTKLMEGHPTMQCAWHDLPVTVRNDPERAVINTSFLTHCLIEQMFTFLDKLDKKNKINYNNAIKAVFIS